MGIAEPFLPEKMIIGVLSSRSDPFEGIASLLEKEFGTVDFESAAIPFTWTHYYDEEMGTPIYRKFFAFQQLWKPEELARIKKRANQLEELWSREGKRRVNLDPGLLSTGRLILASTKGPGHRIALRDGIYAEITLFYRAKQFQPLPWTYPDFRSELYQEILSEIRELYRRQIQDQFPDFLSRH
jgi:hypothetical protein